MSLMDELNSLPTEPRVGLDEAGELSEFNDFFNAPDDTSALISFTPRHRHGHAYHNSIPDSFGLSLTNQLVTSPVLE
jgi:hypothetical protein